ncbi:Ssrp [Trypoxylus dichotomus]
MKPNYSEKQQRKHATWPHLPNKLTNDLKMDFLEYSDIAAEIKGLMTPDKLKMTDQNIIFKNSKTGKVEQIQAGDMDIS